MYARAFITYNGQCEEAIELYKKAFDAKVTGMMRFSDMPPNPNMPPIADNQKNWVMQSTIDFGGNYIRMTDTNNTNNAGDMIAMAIECSEAEAAKAFDVLKEQGTVLMPMGPTFFSPAFGIVQDKFGIRWQIAAAVAPPPGQ